MSRADFRAGFVRAILTRAESNRIALADIPQAARTRIVDAANSFYDDNAVAIEAAPGTPGVTERSGVSVSFQCGLVMGAMVMRDRMTARPSEWGEELAQRMTTTARNARRLRIRRVLGVVSVEEIDG